MKINFSALARPEGITETKEFEDSLQPGVKLSLQFKALDEPSMFMVADETAKQIYARLGDPENGVKPAVAPIIVGGRIVHLSKTIIQTVVTFCLMQTSESPDDCYTFDQFVAMSVTMPNAFRGVSTWADDLNKRYRGKKPSVGETSSFEPLTDDTNPTPT